MTKHSGGGTINPGGASDAGREKRDGEPAGIAADAAAKGEKASPAGRDRGETSPAEGDAPIDLDAARDRAS